ncbi:MAG: hypothetical protein ABL959_01305 [Pyrinomonadaceae bacterium]
MNNCRFNEHNSYSTKLVGVGACRMASIVFLAIVTVFGGEAAGQQTIETTQQLKTACENNAGNVVVLNQATKILYGPRYPFTEEVLTRCTIILGPGAKLETEQISMAFAGPLVIQSTQETDLKLTRTFLSANSVHLNLPADSSSVEMSFSQLDASVGALLVTMGDQGKLTVKNRLVPGPLEALTAATTVQIRGGSQLTAELSEMRISAPQGIDISMNGAEGLLKISTAWLTAEEGNIGISSSVAKGSVDLSSTNLVVGNSASLRLTGSDSQVKLQQVGILGVPDAPPALGGILIETGVDGEGGSIEVSDSGFYNAAFLTIRASANGPKGGLKIQKSNLIPSGDIVLETGPQGQTEVKENYGSSPTRLRIATGAGGSCLAQQNSITAPVMQVCQ